jgi:hypothetical protein
MTIDIYDNGGKTFDRYTIFIDNFVYGMSENPLGFNQYCGDYKRIDGEIMIPKGRHLGKKVNFYDLNEDLQRAIKDRI